MSEPTRPIHQPRVDADGSLVAHTVATPTAFKVRARVTVGSRKVIPVIFVPGIMGSNLRVRHDRKPQEGGVLKPGEAAWRPPNGAVEAYREKRKWTDRSPAQRQLILDGSMLEVDPNGDLDYQGSMLDESVMRERGWGEVHAASYSGLLVDLQRRLDKTYRRGPNGQAELRPYWKLVMQVEPERWGVRKVESVTETELQKYAAFQYPVYAFGYNWLVSCEVSAQQLRRRIEQIKKFWTERKHECGHIILVTHSMGGLVARACARLSEPGEGATSDIAGVIHGVMPATGAPVAYRRIAGGTEGASFSNTLSDNIQADAFAQIAGVSAAETTPVMALAPGVLQLLPNQLYPRPWLLIKTIRTLNRKEEVRDLLALPDGNPYDFYRDMQSWYRMIDPELADPALRYKNESEGVQSAILSAIRSAERFHTQLLVKGESGKAAAKPYYHANTYVFYGEDRALKTFTQIRWAAREPASGSIALTPANLRSARLMQTTQGSTREVEIDKGYRLRFSMWPQDGHGDETVPVQSGSAPERHVRGTFAAGGFRHQDSFKHEDMLLLTRHLIVKIVQDIR